MNKNLQEGIALATEINDLLKAEKPTKQCPSVFTSTDSEDEVVEF